MEMGNDNLQTKLHKPNLLDGIFELFLVAFESFSKLIEVPSSKNIENMIKI